MRSPLNRRRFLQIAATAALVGALPASGVRAETGLHRWHGRALGGEAEILLPRRSDSEKLSLKLVNEIKRLEKIFSLYDNDSEITQLNRTAVIDNPSPELYELLEKAQRFSHLTDGSFDITVQPLWDLHMEADRFPDSAFPRLERSVRELVDYQKLELQQDKISFAQKGMAITLNGIAQGYITDRITRMLIAEGYDNCLVNLGEIRALGQHPDQRNWSISVAAPGPDARELFSLSLRPGEAVATSASLGTRFRDGTPHLLDPKAEKQELPYQTLSVVAPDATTADALSTGFSFLSQKEIQTAISSLENITVHVTDRDGKPLPPLTSTSLRG
ncbi:FAD:protein FMN transferase [Kiloniella laminariae]|uniref:FAD:protein FMN transferase n=1 Tax=Kiloniella laminariae TaxID=454162 RepID=A0ABT4LKC1_9PROT|nr:FAD:protein FMN transferase [Kiloniella laminariae]MCZ4281400.1 FAD:protein FMN transferase [Kiloniella laminariae]